MTQPSDLFLSAAEMGRASKQRQPEPYQIRIEQPKRVMWFIGCRHSYSPTDPQIPELTRIWQDWLQRTAHQTRQVFTEGGPRQLADTPAEAIQANGEAGLMTYLADQAQIVISSPEPSLHEEINELAQQFSRDQVMYYYFARAVAQWYRFETRPDFEQYIQRYLDRNQKASGWVDYDFSLEHFKALHDQQAGHPFSLEDRQCMADSSNPVENEVAAASSLYRNQYIFEAIQRQWEANVSLFVVFGSGHAFTLEKALRKYLV